MSSPNARRCNLLILACYGRMIWILCAERSDAWRGEFVPWCKLNDREREGERMIERTKFDTNPYAPNGNNIHSEPASIRRLENNVCARAIVLLYVYVFTHKRLIEWRYSTAMNVTRRTLLVMLHARAIDYTFSSLSIAREMCVLYIHYTTFVHFVENQRNSLPFDGRSVYSMWTHTYLFFFLNGKITWTEYAVRLDFIWFLCW